MIHSTPLLRRRALYLLMVPGIILIAACSLDSDTAPSATATPIAATAGPGDVTVGTLIDRSRDAWDTVEQWSSKTRTEAPADSPSAAATGATIEQVVPPDKRRLVMTNGDTIISELIAIGDTIFMRGTLVPPSLLPDGDAGAWISFTADQVPDGTPLQQQVSYLTTPPGFPFARVTDETRALPANPVGEVQVDGRTCSVYHFATTEPDGSPGIDYRIAFDAEKRPCELVREGGGVVETRTWSYAPDFSITPPKKARPIDAFPSTP